jgi:hypothetical protein
MKETIKKLGLDKGINEMVKLYKRIPKSGEIPSDNALILHVLFWQMKTKLSDMVTKAERYELDIKQKRDNLDVDIQSESEEKSEAAKQRVSKANENWRKLQDQRLEARVLTQYLKMKRDDFDQAVYVMRTVVTNGRKDEESMPTQEV